MNCNRDLIETIYKRVLRDYNIIITNQLEVKTLQKYLM